MKPHETPRFHIGKTMEKPMVSGEDPPFELQGPYDHQEGCLSSVSLKN